MHLLKESPARVTESAFRPLMGSPGKSRWQPRARLQGATNTLYSLRLVFRENTFEGVKLSASLPSSIGPTFGRSIFVAFMLYEEPKIAAKVVPLWL